MRFSTSALLAIASAPLLALAQDSNGSNPFNIPTTSLNTEAGETVNLTWKPTTKGTITILLRSGASNDLNKGVAIASNIDNNGAFTWNVPSDIVRGSNYALEIVDDADESNTNYTPPFVIESTNNAAPSPSSSSMASSTASSMTDSSMMPSSTDSMSMTMTDSSMMSSMTSGTAAVASSASHHASGNSTASMTTSSSTRGSSSAPTGDAQDVQESEGGAARTSTFAGLLGLVALGALAL